MTYQEVLSKIDNLSKYGMIFGLDRIIKLLEFLDNPQKKLNFIHVAGSNGKGSVCAIISSIMSNAGYKTGLFTSPHLVDVRERFKINDIMISQKKFTQLSEKIFNYIEIMRSKNEFVTQFEFFTALAFQYFYMEGCQIVVLETGLGGRLDATNVIDNPILSIITSISLEHTSILGNTLTKIAIEKAGIIKNNSNTILSPVQDEQVIKTISRISKERNNNLIISNQNNIREISSDLYTGTKFLFNGIEFSTSLLGDHQLENICTALTAIDFLRKKFKISLENVISGLQNINLHARFEVLSSEPLIIVDCGHNPDGIKKLSLAIKKYLKDKYVIGIFTMLKDKNIDKSLKYISQYIDYMILTSIKNDRNIPIEELYSKVRKHIKNISCTKDVKEAFNLAISDYCIHQSNCAIVVFGSLFLVGEFFSFLSLKNF